MLHAFALATTLALFAPQVQGVRPGTATQEIEFGTFPDTWINGTNCGTEPNFQVHAYNPDFYIVRQSVCTNYEAPFLYLIFGTQKAILFDTGAGNVQVGAKIREIRDAWLAAHGLSSIQLIVAHLHAHGDHVAGDSQFAGQPNTTVVGTSLTSVRNFFGITTWPTQIVSYDLGGRVIDIIPIPGHHTTHIAAYDRRTGLLLTGDSLYPGRLYVNGATSQGNWNIYKTSMQRLVNFTAMRPSAWVLGTHIEMSTTPFDDYPIGALSHPNEHVLQLTRGHLLELHNSLQLLPTPQVQVHADFIISPSG